MTVAVYRSYTSSGVARALLGGSHGHSDDRGATSWFRPLPPLYFTRYRVIKVGSFEEVQY